MPAPSGARCSSYRQNTKPRDVGTSVVSSSSPWKLCRPLANGSCNMEGRGVSGEIRAGGWEGNRVGRNGPGEGHSNGRAMHGG